MALNLYAHSQGGLMVSNLKHKLSDDIRRRMHVNTFGSATQIRDGDFGKVVNYVSSRDVVPWSDPFGMLRAHFSGGSSNTVVLKSNHRGFDTVGIMKHIKA